jgi:hypothetical protein
VGTGLALELQFKQRAKMRAVVVFPHPLGPLKR